MPTVKHDRTYVENNPRYIRDDEVQRYLIDGWRVIESESQPGKQLPVETFTIKPEIQKQDDAVATIIPETISTAFKPDIYRGRGRPPNKK